MKNKKQSEIVVFGDVMLDEYFWGTVDRISPEAPIPVLNHCATEHRLGGAANVALNIKYAGASVSIIGCIGNDTAGIHVKNLVESNGIKNNLIISPNLTTTKTRVMAMGHQLLRIDKEEVCGEDQAAKLLKELTLCISSVKAVVISDYAKGVIRNISNIVDLAREYAIPVIVDPKSIDLENYKSCYLITPNLKEFKSFNSYNKQLSIYENALAFARRFDITWIVVTLGADGILAVNMDGNQYKLRTESKDVLDVTGAGDTVLAFLTVGIINGLTVEEALDQANRAAGVSVSRIGTTPVSIQEIDGIKKSKVYPLSAKSEFNHLLESCRRGGRTIVMTNGCFDILHPGHIDYLEKSKKLGDFLVVAVNSDESVSLLKGKGRPINTFTYRAKMLSSIHVVDAVVEFDESTPEYLINEVAPNILTKGADYRMKKVAGSESVEKKGGKVVFIDFLEQYSTTNFIKRILDKSLL